MGVYPAIFFLVLLSWTAGQADCDQPFLNPMKSETEKALEKWVEPAGKNPESCRVIECLSRHEPSRPVGWTIRDFVDGHKRCWEEFKLNMGQIEC